MWERLFLSLAGAATSIIFVTTKHIFCHDKSMLVATKVCLLWQNIFVATKVFCDKYLSWQTCVCHDRSFVTTKDVFCHDKHMFVATKVSFLWQNFCCDKIMFVVIKVLSQKTCFVMTNTSFSQENFCRDKNNTCGSSRQYSPCCLVLPQSLHSHWMN